MTAPRRRWFRFSLRTMLLIVAAVSIGLGWAIHEARMQGLAVAEFENSSCSIHHNRSDEPLTLLE